MRKQTKSRKPESIGNGKVTPVQVAFLVDRYLADNNFTNTRSSFRNEASHLLSRSPIQEAPKSLLSLGELIDEYIDLKGKKVILDQEKGCIQQENIRVQNLIKGMQDVMNAYNNFGANVAALPQPVLVKPGALVPRVDPTIGSPPGFSVYNTHAAMPESRPFNTPTTSKNLSIPSTYAATLKRKNGADDSVTAKRSCRQAPKKLLQTKDNRQQNDVSNRNLQSHSASPHLNISGVSSVQGSSVAKCLFNQSSKFPPNNSSSPNTPPQATSTPTEIIASPQDTMNAGGNNVPPQHMTSTKSTLIASETITVSPTKQITYSVERNCRISSSSPIKTDVRRVNTRDHVKGRLDFDESDLALSTDKPKSWEVSASETGKEVDYGFDFDFPNLDALGPDFNFSELLGEFGLDSEEMNCSFQPVMDSSSGSRSGSPNTPEEAGAGANQFISEFSSTVTEVLSEKNMNVTGPDSVTSMKSITKSIKILSPVKKQRIPSKDQENVSLRNRLH